MSALLSPLSASNDRLLRLAGPLGLFITGMSFFRFRMYLETPAHLILNQVLIALTCGYIGWELSRYVALYFQQRFPGLQRITKRIFFLFISLIVLAHIGYVLRRVAHLVFDREPLRWPTLLDYTGATSVVIFYTTVTLGIYESAYLLKQWKLTFAEKEQLLQSEWQARYDLLKARINPHFLFNSLNSLSSLITEDPERAEKYTDEMSRVYRYLLRNNNQELVPLATELDFIRSYCHLLQTRHGDGLIINIDVPRQYSNYLLPSLTLQLLVENAVKHNAIAKDSPLEICIGIDENSYCIVKNNINKKSILVHSSGIGLKNINAKFHMLNMPSISVQEVNNSFVVRIPLVETGMVS